LFRTRPRPGKRAQLGAHYTSREDIETIVDAGRHGAAAERNGRRQSEVEPLVKETASKKQFNTARAKLRAYLERLQAVRVLDPACGSGNFLYVALQKLKDLEKGGDRLRGSPFRVFPQVGRGRCSASR